MGKPNIKEFFFMRHKFVIKFKIREGEKAEATIKQLQLNTIYAFWEAL